MVIGQQGRQAIVACDAEPRAGLPHVEDNVAVRQLHAFLRARRAGGVEYLGEIVGLKGRLARGLRLGGVLPGILGRHDLPACAGHRPHATCVVRFADHDAGIGVVERVTNQIRPVAEHVVLERDGDGSEPEDGVVGNDPTPRVRHKEGHRAPGSRAALGQPSGEGVDLPLQFGERRADQPAPVAELPQRNLPGRDPGAHGQNVGEGSDAVVDLHGPALRVLPVTLRQALPASPGHEQEEQQEPRRRTGGPPAAGRCAGP